MFMETNEFWSIIGMLDWDESGDDEAVIEPVVNYLSKVSIEEIYQFEELLSQKLHALDTKAHAKEIGEDAYIDENKYFSPDAFLYSRCVIVANGEEIFDHVLNNPSDFPKDMEFEAILYVAQEAYERKTGQEWEYSSPTDYESFKNVSGWQ